MVAPSLWALDQGLTSIKNAKGDFSRLSVTAMARAEELQLLATAYIKEAFNVESDEVDIRTMTFQDFLRALDVANKNGTREEFEKRLATQLMAIIPQAMQPPPTEGNV